MDCLACPCADSPRQGMPVNQLRTVNAARVIALIDMSRHALSLLRRGRAAWAAEVGSAPVSSVHVTAGGDAMVSSCTTAGNEGDVVLRGTIAAFACALHLHVQLAGSLVSLELSVTQPMALGPIAWRFELLGPVSDTAGNIVSASGVAAAIGDSAGNAAAGHSTIRETHLPAWRFLHRVGDLALPTLVQCLPSLAAGADAYVACVVARLGSHDSAAMAEYLVSDELFDPRRSI